MRRLRTALCERLGIALPTIQAPVGSAAGPELAAAVSEAGGLNVACIPSAVLRKGSSPPARWTFDFAATHQKIHGTATFTDAGTLHVTDSPGGPSRSGSTTALSRPAPTR